MSRCLVMAVVSAALLFTSCASDSSKKQIESAVLSQMERYPESTLKDLYKNFFQDAFGPGHLMSTSEDARQGMETYVLSECQQVKDDDSPCPLYESTGYVGRFYRVNLSLVEEGVIPFDDFMDAFIKSAEQFTLPPIDDWKREWDRIESVIRSLDLGLPDFEKDSEDIHALLNAGEYASHHSKAYENAYNPHYRLIEKGIFESELLPLIDRH